MFPIFRKIILSRITYRTDISILISYTQSKICICWQNMKLPTQHTFVDITCISSHNIHFLAQHAFPHITHISSHNMHFLTQHAFPHITHISSYNTHFLTTYISSHNMHFLTQHTIANEIRNYNPFLGKWKAGSNTKRNTEHGMELKKKFG